VVKKYYDPETDEYWEELDEEEQKNRWSMPNFKSKWFLLMVAAFIGYLIVWAVR